MTIEHNTTIHFIVNNLQQRCKNDLKVLDLLLVSGFLVPAAFFYIRNNSHQEISLGNVWQKNSSNMPTKWALICTSNFSLCS